MKAFLMSKAHYMLVSCLVLMGTTADGFGTCDKSWQECVKGNCRSFVVLSGPSRLCSMAQQQKDNRPNYERACSAAVEALAKAEKCRFAPGGIPPQ